MAWTDILTRRKTEPATEVAADHPIRLVTPKLEADLRRAFQDNPDSLKKIDALVAVDVSVGQAAWKEIGEVVPAMYKLFESEMRKHTTALSQVSGEGAYRATVIHQTLAEHLPKLHKEFTTEINKAMRENGVEAQFYPEELGGSKGAKR